MPSLYPNGDLVPTGPSPCGPLPPALPPRAPRYVIPGSFWLDPAYAEIPRRTSPWRGGWPFPRVPWPAESESRAAGTGLIRGAVPCHPHLSWWLSQQRFVMPVARR
jgi:hypothetical protein